VRGFSQVKLETGKRSTNFGLAKASNSFLRCYVLCLCYPFIKGLLGFSGGKRGFFGFSGRIGFFGSLISGWSVLISDFII
tara:strand:+ start:4589 stop:4828 length:240 start_codon:yes stop_codon:yes gene_type:complete